MEQSKFGEPTRCFDLFAELLRQGLGNQPAKRGACGDASHTTVLLLQGRSPLWGFTGGGRGVNLPSPPSLFETSFLPPPPVTPPPPSLGGLPGWSSPAVVVSPAGVVSPVK